MVTYRTPSRSCDPRRAWRRDASSSHSRDFDTVVTPRGVSASAGSHGPNGRPRREWRWMPASIAGSEVTALKSPRHGGFCFHLAGLRYLRQDRKNLTINQMAESSRMTVAAINGQRRGLGMQGGP